MMSIAFHQCLIYLLMLTYTFQPITAETGKSKRKKISLPSHITDHQPVLCWILRFRDEVYNETIFTDRKHLNLTYSNSVGEFYKDHHVYCHTFHETAQRGNFTELQKSHDKLRQDNQRHFNKLVDTFENHLELHPNVKWYSQETVRSRQKRSIDIYDPYFHRQWHLVNRQIVNMDVNVTGVWERNITGHGVTVAVVDDGVEWTNKDLQENYNYLGSWDLNDDDPDPMPSDSKVNNHHGTRCAGEIAAVANDICGVGVAYNSKISGLRVLDGPMTDSLEATAFNKKMQINDVYSCSWGPDDDGKTVDGPHIMAAKAMKFGVDFGRKGYGSIFVVASGNGGRHHDNCNYDGYANSIYTVTIGAVDEIGHMPYYAEECASMLGVTFSSGKANNRDIVTTDWTKRNGAGCTERHTGTSAAAPLAAGMIALMLQVRPCLTWRDVQYIIILTALKVDVDVAHWQKNGAGLYHSHKHGFGLLKAWRLVNAAKIWETVPWITSFSYGVKDINLQIPKNNKTPLVIEHTVSEDAVQGYDLYILEYVQVTVTITHPVRGKLSLKLKCPSGTNSVIGADRALDRSAAGFSDWTFSTVRCWGEQPVGKWIITITDSDTEKGFGYVKKWRLRLFGTPLTPEDFQERRQKIEEAMSGVYLNDSFSLPCLPPPVTSKPDVPFTIKTLKILVLASAFCMFMAVYETFEYIFCYNEEKREHQRRMELALQAHDMSQNAANHDSNDEVTESTSLLQGEEMTVMNSTQEVTLDGSNFMIDDLQTVDLESNNTNSDLSRNHGDCDNLSIIVDSSLVSNNQTLQTDVDDDFCSSSGDKTAKFESLSLSEEEEVPSLNTAASKVEPYDWLKYTKNR
ncbi:proprotein convertase subtilisin/kexin type 7 isoform X1 [Patella vulgata]|uniref:proprotein convertase subtilisin/kexin type 7 isoform X1 n=2 Tax=Patella vulgata TaxID=6465 RepID=UPI0024A83B43|nr:proprotein convertase subtilisin/kexin type 7 isoform X1 [Patella vulgata]